jgi:hypothetical protein
MMKCIIIMPTSYFLFLNNKNLTLPTDRTLYKALTRNTYKQEAFKFGYMLLLCKLYDMSNLPAPFTKMIFYGSIIGIIGTYSFYKASLKHVNVLDELDRKYADQYTRYIKSKAEQ